MGLDLLMLEVSRSHSDTSHWVGLFWTSDRPVAETWQHTQQSQETDIHAPGGTRTHNPSKRAAADSRRRPRGHWDRRRLTIPSRFNTLQRRTFVVTRVHIFAD